MAGAKVAAVHRRNEINAALRGYGIPESARANQMRYAPDGVNYWTAHASDVPVPSPCAGDWRLLFYYRYRDVPDSENCQLFATSVGLALRDPRMHWPIRHNASVFHGNVASFVRFDSDRLPGQVGAHIQVLQPGPLGSSVHFMLPGHEPLKWNVQPTLAYLCDPSSRLWKDLLDNGWKPRQ